MLLTEHEKYHHMGPKDVSLKEKASIMVSRTTNQTGEQIHCEVPVYPDDTREQVKARMNFFMSIMQDRLEDENKAVQALNEKAQTIRVAKEALKRNNERFQKETLALEKRLKKKAITQEQFEEELKLRKEALETANKNLEEAITKES